MNPARKIDADTVLEERIFTFRCRVKGCGREVDVSARASAGARGVVLKAGWDFRKEPLIDGTLAEYWTCPEHTQEINEIIARHRKRKKRARTWSTEQPKMTEDERNVELASTRHTASLTSFERAFGRILSAAEMTACARLRNAMQVVEIAGNACQSYDGSPVDSCTYGSKTIQERVLDAQGYVKRCKRAIIGNVQMVHHDAWKVLTMALERDWTVQQTGDEVCRMRRDRRNEKHRRTLGAAIVQKASAAIVDISGK